MTDLLKTGKKTNNRKSGEGARRAEQRRLDAKTRQATYDALTPMQRLEKLNMGGFAAKRERARISKV